jgi:hypothetical protein
MPQLALDIAIAASPQRVFAGLVDWQGQSRWMLGTKVWVPAGASGVGVGGRIEAFTGFWKLGFLDTMEITTWDEPHRVNVVHTGRVVRGTGTMVVNGQADGTSRFLWSEDLELPLGALGRLGWVVVKPGFRWGVLRSLKAFAALVEAGELGIRTA